MVLRVSGFETCRLCDTECPSVAGDARLLLCLLPCSILNASFGGVTGGVGGIEKRLWRQNMDRLNGAGVAFPNGTGEESYVRPEGVLCERGLSGMGVG